MEWWRWLRHPAFWMPVADAFAILTAASLPWSTSAVGIFTACWLGSSALIIDYPAWFRSLKQPICAMPLALFALAAAGTLWSEASWDARIYALTPAIKLLFLPGLFQYFERSTRGMWVFVAFLGSCTLLMALSWLVLLEPGLAIKGGEPQRGVFVKNYIDQGQEFALCAVALTYPIYVLLRERRFWPALSFLGIVLGLLANMIFVIVSRTAMVTMPIMLAVFAALHLRLRTSVMIFAAAALLAGASWAASSQLRSTVHSVFSDYQRYKKENAPTSIGLRLEYWQKSLQFIREAPLAGHGTGSTRTLFEGVAAKGDPELVASANIIGNPHNQTLNVAVQWGVIGVVVLWAMWISHLLLFRGESLVAWIGLLVVVQNIFTSLFNSHIFDFHQGWMYVLGVGVAGGMMMKRRSGEASSLQ
ncbi:O-antigen ligase family protein [Bradyrhizobium sp.]|uniref:O-antigen ligase family protein n=1 Tax=Bradyrhizobium sp. TaxID=376 RepID=UPI001DE70CA6|nr:O-antigen ligase family protein [Bradyrhizobium sp.]MBI5321023.1 O-antigen ligase family protein [Bradyrhizobium sp.]